MGCGGAQGGAGSAFLGGGSAQGGNGSAFMGGGPAQGGGRSAFFGGYVGSLQGAGGPAFMGPGFAQGGGGPAFVGAGSGHGYGGGASFDGGSEFMGGYGGGASFHGGASSFQGDTSSFDGGYDSRETPTGRRGTGAGRGGRCRNARRRVEDDSDRAAWTPELTKTFCEIFCAVMDSGNDNCVRGKMTPRGWSEVGTRFRKATTLVHTEGQFTYIYNKLRREWNYIVGKLRNGSGLGRGAGKTVTADEFWWKKEAEGDPNILKLKDQIPKYIDEMEKMFSGHVADGSTSYAPGQRTVHDIPSDDADNEDEQDAQEAEEGDDDLFAQDATDVATPASVGSKRSSSDFSKRTSGGFSTPSLHSTGSSPNKKVKSPAVNAMTSSLGGLREVIHGYRHHVDGTLTAVRAERQAREALHQARVAERAAAEERMLRRLEAAEQKKKEQQDRVDEIIRLAAEVGVDDTSPDYEGLMRIIQCDNAMQLFIRSD